MTDTPVATQRVVFVTGPSGSGRSTAIHALEDLDFEVIDNLPLSLVARVVAAPARRPLALGIDARNREFSTDGLRELIFRLRQNESLDVQLLFLDARRNILLNRFSETRRRHPLAPAETPGDGIDREYDLLTPIRELADTLIDTSELTVHQLRAEIEKIFALQTGAFLALSLESFSYKRGLPRGLDMAFDVRFLRNPYWNEDLRKLTGLDKAVQDHIADDPRFEPFFSQLNGLISSLLPAYIDEGKSHLSIGFGCTGGQHRSVTLAETLGRALAEQGWSVAMRHRELERRGAIGANSAP